jgi:signal transduction histidine kinase
VGLPTTYGWGRLTRMAIHTAVGFIALGSGVIIYAWRTQSVREAGIPEWLHIPSGISSVTISICLWQALLAGGAPAPLPAVGLGVGLVMSALITSMLHFVIVSRKRAAQYRDVNSRLKAQIGERQHAEGELRTLANTLDQRVSERTKDLRDSQTAALNMMEDAQDARREAEIAEQEQGRLIEELKAKNTEMEQFTYTVSHDLKSPLITIQGFLGLLERDVAANDQTRIKSDMEHIQIAGNRMSQLLDELLELSRVGRLLNDPQEISLTDLSTQAVELVAGRIAEAGVEVVIQPGMPTVTGDVVRLREVVQNLLDNAVKYLGDQPNPRIAITALRNGDETTIRVSDNGIGIEPKYHAKIFGLFDQLNKSSEGVGMGLPLVKRIVEIHDGRVWVESAGPGSGSTFCFTLPDHAMIDSEDSAQDDVHAIDSNEYAQGAPS